MNARDSTRPRVLILDVDANAGLSVLQSLGAAGYACIAGAAVKDAPAFSSRWAKQTVIYPNPLEDAEAFKTWMAAWVRANDVELIIPVAECTLVPLHEMRGDGDERIAKLVAMPSAEAVERSIDKERLRELAVELAVSVPASAIITQESELGGPQIDAFLREGAAVVKTTKSKAWKGERAHEFATVVVSDREELRRLVLERIPYAAVQVQAWVPGRGLGVEILANHGEIVMSIAHERLHEVPLTGGGSSYRRTIPMPPALFEDAQRLMRALDYHGVAMIEFRGDPETGRHWLMEINIRFWGSLPLAMFAGADFPRALAELLLEGKVPDKKASRTDVFARKIERDLKWTKLILKSRGRSSPYELTRPLGPSLLEWGRIFTGKEAWDGATLEDPVPFVREVSNILSQEIGAAVTRMKRKAIQRAAIRTSRARAERVASSKRLLVLCHGNICRSAYADVKLRALLGSTIEIRSAGFYPKEGRSTPEDFQEVAREHGVDLSAHRSTRVSKSDLDWADWVIVMDQRNYDHLQALDRTNLKKVIWLGALDGKGVQIEDPYGEGDAEMRSVLARLDACLAVFAPESIEALAT